ncbi:MAG: class I SAM-dependent methyltransferase [Desulfotomaculales bacterium]
MPLDWVAEWERIRQESSWCRRLTERGITSVEYWDGFPDELLEDHYRFADYPGPTLNKVLALAGRVVTALDIGAGNGAYTVPLARMAARVTAVEPSGTQVGRLLKKAAGLGNVRIINKRWEDVSLQELEEYDLVNAAYCFAMPDIRAALEKMLWCTKGVVFLITNAGSCFESVYPLFISGYNDAPQYIYLYNILYQMGIKANVEIITRRYLYPWELLQGLWEHDYGIAPEGKARALDYFRENGMLVNRDGALWVRCWYKDAVIWYRKEHV